jgi:hypothetical protein
MERGRDEFEKRERKTRERGETERGREQMEAVNLPEPRGREGRYQTSSRRSILNTTGIM